MANQKIFILCPLKPEFDDLLFIIRNVAAELNVEATRSDDLNRFQKSIVRSIYAEIESADVIVCDISDNNGNVMYELGIAHAMGKRTIVICRNDVPIPFDVASLRVLIYDRNSLSKSFRKPFQMLLKEVLNSSAPWSYYKNNKEEPENKNLFISYSHKDKDCLDRLMVHLKPLEKEGIIDLWVDTKISAGDKWKTKIEESLRKARVALLIISADFLASDFIVDNELPPLLSAAESKGTRIIPIVFKPCRFSRDKNLSSFQSINDPREPLVKMELAEQEEIYDKVSELVESYMRKE